MEETRSLRDKTARGFLWGGINNGTVQVHRSLSDDEMRRLSVTLGNSALTDDAKKLRIAGMVNSVVVSEQASQNFEQGMEQQSRDVSMHR